MRKEDILIVGCGCLGSALAAEMASYCNVFCYDTDHRVVRAVSRKGIICGGKAVKGVRIVLNMQEYKGRVFDGVIFTTKCHHVRLAAEQVVRHCDAKRVLFLQNGDFSLAWTKQVLGKVDICRGVTTLAVSSDAPGVVNILFHGRIYLGSYAGSIEGALWFENLFKREKNATSVVKDHRSAVWSKLIFSSMMNPLPVLLGCDYGIIRKEEDIYELVHVGIKEGKKVARALKIPLAFDPMDIVCAVRHGKYGGSRHMGSMYQDFLGHRPSEIEYITGVVIVQARKFGLRTPVLDMVYALIKAMEKHSGFKG